MHLRLPGHLQPDVSASMRAISSRCAAPKRCPTRPASSATRSPATRTTSCTDRSACCHPLRRTGPKGSGEFARISWDDGAGRDLSSGSATVIGRWGPQAVMPLNYAGPHGFLAGDSMSLRFFHRLGATQLYRRGIVRRGAQRGVGRDLWRRSRVPARIRRARQAQRRLGQQRDGRQSAPRPQHPPRQAQGRQAGRRRPAAHQDRRAG